MERKSPLIELNDYSEICSPTSIRFNPTFFDVMTKNYWEYREQKLADLLGWGFNDLE